MFYNEEEQAIRTTNVIKKRHGISIALKLIHKKIHSTHSFKINKKGKIVISWEKIQTFGVLNVEVNQLSTQQNAEESLGKFAKICTIAKIFSELKFKANIEGVPGRVVKFFFSFCSLQLVVMRW